VDNKVGLTGKVPNTFLYQGVQAIFWEKGASWKSLKVLISRLICSKHLGRNLDKIA
jgi:hypothetical protein